MADRVSASITIGGKIRAELVEALVDAINEEGLSFEYDGGPITADEIAFGEPLELFATQVAWGAFDTLEDFCRAHDLPYSRWYEACAGAWGSGRSIYRGDANTSTCLLVDEYDASEHGHILIDAATARTLGSYEAIIAYFATADFAVPSIEIIPTTALPQTDATAVPA